MTRFEMFMRLFEPERGWASREEALRAFRGWEAATRKPEDVLRAVRTWEATKTKGAIS